MTSSPIWWWGIRARARTSSARTLLAAEAFGSAVPYGVGGTHRHIPEILQNFAHAAGLDAARAEEFTLGFTPILAPMARGILATVSAKMTDKALSMSDEEIHDVWARHTPARSSSCCWSRARSRPRRTSSDRTPPTCRWSPTGTPGRLIAFAAIDNLNRGTAGQAVQSLNVALGLPEDKGLTKIGVAP